VSEQRGIIDGMNWVYRAHHAMPMLTNHKGDPVGMLVGFMPMLRAALAICKKTVVVFDGRGKNFRHKLYPDYKGNRPEQPDEIKTQLPMLIEWLAAYGLPVLRIKHWEADDVIATLARQSDMPLLIHTGDKDMYQLVNKRVKIVTPKNEIHGLPEARSKFGGLRPDQVQDFLALTGDGVDNVPGVKGCGSKTAIKLLNDWGSIDEVLSNRKVLPTVVRKALSSKEVRKQLRLSRKLVALNYEAPVDMNKLKWSRPDIPRLRELCSEFGLRKEAKFIDDLEGHGSLFRK
jgi:DNA polymerase-1